MGVRLGWDVISFGDSPHMMWRMARPYLPVALAAFGLTALIYALAVRGIQAWNRRLRPGAGTGAGSPGRGVWYALASFVLLGDLGWFAANPDKAEGQAGVRLVQTSPVWKTVTNHKDRKSTGLNSTQLVISSAV